MHFLSRYDVLGYPLCHRYLLLIHSETHTKVCTHFLREKSVTGDTLEALVKKYVMLKAKCIQTQNLAPDVSLSHVMKLLKEHIWQFKQIFSHFGIQSLVEVSGRTQTAM